MRLLFVCVAVLCLTGTFAMTLNEEKNMLEGLEELLKEKVQERQTGSGSGMSSGGGQQDTDIDYAEYADELYAVGREMLDLGVKCIVWGHLSISGYLHGGSQPTLSAVCPEIEPHVDAYENADDETKKEIEKFFFENIKKIYMALSCLNLHSTYDTFWETGASCSKWGGSATSKEAMYLLGMCEDLFKDIAAEKDEAVKDFEKAEQKAKGGKKRSLTNMVNYAKLGHANKHFRK